MISFMVFYIATAIPFKIAFTYRRWWPEARWLEDVEVFIDGMFIIDALLQFLHGYMDAGYPILEPRRIALR